MYIFQNNWYDQVSGTEKENSNVSRSYEPNKNNSNQILLGLAPNSKSTTDGKANLKYVNLSSISEKVERKRVVLLPR